MTQEQKKDERTPEEIAAAREIQKTRGAALLWAAEGTNTEDYINPEYRRRVDRGEGLMVAWRRAIWVSFKRHGQKC